MHRLSIVFLFLLFLFSCNRHLVVREINTRNITVTPNTASVVFVMKLMVKHYLDSIEEEMNTLIAISAAPLAKGNPESKLINPMNLHSIAGVKGNPSQPWSIIFDLSACL